MKRVNIYNTQPEAYHAIFAVEKYVKESNLQPLLEELIRTRVSQINGCAYCIQMHTQSALKAGESAERLFALTAWRESTMFTSEERAALALCDEITHISNSGVSDDTYTSAQRYFSDEKMSQIITLISLMNLWNRIAVSTKIA